MADDIVTRLRKIARIHKGRVGHECINEAADEIERLRRCLQHAINHVGKWGLFTAKEQQSLIAEYEQAVRGE